MINLIYTILCILCLCIGFFVGYKIAKQERLNISVPNPVKTIKNRIEDQKEEEKNNEILDELNTIYNNIENYDGSSKNQKEVKGIEINL